MADLEMVPELTEETPEPLESGESFIVIGHKSISGSAQPHEPHIGPLYSWAKAVEIEKKMYAKEYDHVDIVRVDSAKNWLEDNK